ncbi:hypothetical protein [Spirosoma litoris]
MKSVTALFLGILLFVGSLFPQTDVEEVYKIPGLIAHYQLHKKAAGSGFDIWQFLELHYNASSKHAKTPHKGVKIPLYNHLSTGFVFVLTQPHRLPAELAVLIPWPQVHFSYENLYSFLTATLLFQPPQIG